MHSKIFKKSVAYLLVTSGLLIINPLFIKEKAVASINSPILNLSESFLDKHMLKKKNPENKKISFKFNAYNKKKLYDLINENSKNSIFQKKTDLKTQSLGNMEKESPEFNIEKTPPKLIGKGTCPVPEGKDNPGISSTKNKNHMDEDCCPDFDEWPKPGCMYSAKDYAIMLNGPTDRHVDHYHMATLKKALKLK